MVRRKLIIPLVALATMALMFSATGASALPHETVGELVGECVVDGSVALDGLDNNPSSNHYRFEQAELDCVGEKGGVYAVEAEGDTADFEHQLDEPDVGETCAQGGSITEDQDGDDDVHSGWLEAVGPKDMIGEVHFVRLGENVLADGPLWEGFNDHNDLPTAKQNPPDQWFQAELVFQPTQGDCFNKNDPVTAADLTGIAEIYENVVAHNCGGDEPKDTKDDHCFSL